MHVSDTTCSLSKQSWPPRSWTLMQQEKIGGESIKAVLPRRPSRLHGWRIHLHVSAALRTSCGRFVPQLHVSQRTLSRRLHNCGCCSQLCFFSFIVRKYASWGGDNLTWRFDKHFLCEREKEIQPSERLFPWKGVRLVWKWRFSTTDDVH